MVLTSDINNLEWARDTIASEAKYTFPVVVGHATKSGTIHNLHVYNCAFRSRPRHFDERKKKVCFLEWTGINT